MTDTHKGDEAALIELKPKRRARRDWNEAMAQAYSDGQRDALADREWLQDKAWADAVMMLVHYQGAAALPHLVGHDRAVEGLERAWADARRLAATRTAGDIRALNATDDASLVKGEDVDLIRDFADKVLDEATNCCTDPDAGPDSDTHVRFSGEQGCAIASALHRLLAARGAGQGEAVATAWADGFISGVGRRPWEDCADWAAVTGVAYAAGEGMPSTMPEPVFFASPPVGGSTGIPADRALSKEGA